MTFDLTNFKGYLRSTQYTLAVEWLEKMGIKYVDSKYGLDRYYWDKGLYRVSTTAVYPIFSTCLSRPHECQRMRYCSMAYQFRQEM